MKVSRSLRAIPALLALTLPAACSTEPAQRQAGAGTAVTAPAASCAMTGGTMEPRGLTGRPTCVVRFADAGKVCSGKADCRGNCLSERGFVEIGAAAQGRCQAENTPFGCHAEVEGGRIATPFLCTE